MNFLSRKGQTTKTETVDDGVLYREIEITVEREWLSIRSRGQGEESVQDAGAPTQVKKPPTRALPKATRQE